MDSSSDDVVGGFFKVFGKDGGEVEEFWPEGVLKVAAGEGEKQPAFPWIGKTELESLLGLGLSIESGLEPSIETDVASLHDKYADSLENQTLGRGRRTGSAICRVLT